MEWKYNQRWNAAEDGVTFIELLAAVVVLGMIAISMPTSFRTSTQIWDRGDRHAEVLPNALIGMEEMTRELRQAREITAYSSNSFIEFENKDEGTSRFELADSHLETGDGVDANVLSGPIDSLTFTLYDENGDPGTIDDDIRAVRIDMNTFDDQNKVDDIPLSSLVYIRKWKEHRAGEEFAIYGDKGVHLNENVGVTGNIGSNGNIILDNGVSVGGTVVHGGDLDSEVEVDHYHGYNLLPCGTDFTASTNPDDDIDIGPNEYDVDEPYILPEGTYRDLIVGNGNAIELSSGNYYFRSIDMGNSINLNFNLETGGNLNIFVVGKVRIGNTLEGNITSSISGGTPAQIYAETHYESDITDPTDVAWWMGKETTWLGTIYASARYGHVYMTDGIIEGSIFAVGQIIIHQFGPSNYINYVPSDYMLSLPYECE